MRTMELITALEISLIFGLVAIGVYLTFRVINFSDMTVDGSFTLGAAISGSMLMHHHNPYAILVWAFIGGCCAGALSAIIHVKWKIMSLLASILVMLALYSVNMRIMGKSNISLLNEETIFSNGLHPLFIIILIVALVSLLISLLFYTHYGLSIRAAGRNEIMSRAYGINVSRIKIVIVSLSNGLAAFAGSIFMQQQGFVDISMGTGMVITGLAAVIIGQKIFSTTHMAFCVLAVLAGSIIYRIAISFALYSNEIGLNASDLNLLTSLIVLFALVYKRKSMLMKE